MKRTLFGLAAATTLFFACGTPSYTSTSSNAAYSTPAALQTSFTTQYPTATNATWTAYDATVVPIDWEMNGWSALDANDHVVSFDMDGERYYSWYDQDGAWVGSTYAVNDYNKLPESVHKTIKEKYSNYSISSVQRETWKDKMAYEVKLKNGDNKIKLLVDDYGNVLKEKMKD